MTLGTLLTIKFEHDSMLGSLRTLSSNSDSVFEPNIEKAFTLKGSQLTDLIASQVQTLRDRQEVKNLLA